MLFIITFIGGAVFGIALAGILFGYKVLMEEQSSIEDLLKKGPEPVETYKEHMDILRDKDPWHAWAFLTIIYPGVWLAHKSEQFRYKRLLALESKN